MFTSVSHRSASAYQRVDVETSISQASPHQLISLLFEGLFQAVGAASAALKRGDIVAKCAQITKAVRIIDEGLKPALNMTQGGELASNLDAVYGYCVTRLTLANLTNDERALEDVVRVMTPVATGWKQIGDQVSFSQQATRH